MLRVAALIPLVPHLLNQFVDDEGLDLSVVDDCLCSQPIGSRCVFGQPSSIRSSAGVNQKEESFRSNQWIKEHPLHLIVECEYAPIYDHPLVIAAVDSKAELFGNLLYLFILIIQALYVALYTGVALTTRTPKFYHQSYVDFENVSCREMCHELTNNTNHFDYTHHGTFVLFIFRFLLFICSCLALSKEFFQLLSQRTRYFRTFFINLLEILTYTCGILFAMGKRTDASLRRTRLSI